MNDKVNKILLENGELEEMSKEKIRSNIIATNTCTNIKDKKDFSQELNKMAVLLLHKESIIHSIGLYKNKARNLILLSTELVKRYNGEVPNTMEELQSLSGVGYKTASVVLVEGFKIPAFPVDTHISRITKRIGLVKESLDPTSISISLMKLYDKSLYHKLHHQMIYLGRYTCKSQKPNCDECLIKDICKYYKK